jgi:hypothetical protein
VIFSVRDDVEGIGEREEKERVLLLAERYCKSIFLQPHLLPLPMKAILSELKSEAAKCGLGGLFAILM